MPVLPSSVRIMRAEVAPAVAPARPPRPAPPELREPSMRTTRLTKLVSFVGTASLVAACSSGEKKATDTTATANAQGAAAPACPAGSDAQLKLPAGFCATIFADTLGPARHMAVAPNGVLYVVFERTKPSPEKQLG